MPLSASLLIYRRTSDLHSHQFGLPSPNYFPINFLPSIALPWLPREIHSSALYQVNLIKKSRYFSDNTKFINILMCNQTGLRFTFNGATITVPVSTCQYLHTYIPTSSIFYVLCVKCYKHGHRANSEDTQFCEREVQACGQVGRCVMLR